MAGTTKLDPVWCPASTLIFNLLSSTCTDFTVTKAKKLSFRMTKQRGEAA